MWALLRGCGAVGGPELLQHSGVDPSSRKATGRTMVEGRGLRFSQNVRRPSGPRYRRRLARLGGQPSVIARKPSAGEPCLGERTEPQAVVVSNSCIGIYVASWVIARVDESGHSCRVTASSSHKRPLSG